MAGYISAPEQLEVATFPIYHDSREILGLGSATKVDRLEIHWPSGQIDKFQA